MSLSDTLLARGFANVLAVHGETLLILSGANDGLSFAGVILAEPDLSLDTELSADPREKVMLYCERNPVTLALSAQAMIQDENLNRWRLVKRSNNPNRTTLEYELIRITPQDT